MQPFHSDVTLNFMLNRLARTVDQERLVAFASRFDDLDGFVECALKVADSAGDTLEAAYFYRGAEFFMAPDHPRKSEAYERFMELFYSHHPDLQACYSSVPFGDGELGVLDLPAKGDQKDIIVACSGFDGLIEEMAESCSALADEGYRVVIYEGPGQGSALRRSHLTMIPDWERAVGAVLDHFDIHSCTLMGVSLGGYLAPRAAAFESRATRLIAWGAMYDFLGCYSKRMDADSYAGLVKLIEDDRADDVNGFFAAAMENNVTARWSIQHGMHTCGATTPLGYLKWASTLHLRDVAAKIEQDTLIVAGTEDHLVPAEQAWDQAGALTGARSVTLRLCTAAESAAEHCQVTNQRLVIDEILTWFDKLNRRDAAQD